MPSSLTNLLYHAVFSTKDRAPDLTPALREDLYPYVGGIVRGERGRLLEIGGTANHVHLLAAFPPTVSVSQMMHRVKGNSSHWAPGNARFGWQRGYAAFTVSESVAGAVRAYIEGQEEHHKKQTFEAEYLALLRKHGVVFDERYIWD
jgi:putative transposase